ncbi:MAG: hypothetical protein ACI9KI_002040 [Patiriisocius sp.]|jgi:uncharacterized protein (DUF2141 family)
MNVIVKIVVTIIISFIITETKAQEKYNITVIVKDADSNAGKIFLALYNTDADFLNTSFKGMQSAIENEQCTVTFQNIPAGVYAVSIFHDENDNGKMDSNFMGIPKEDYACSNDASAFMGPPKWDDAKFQLKENKSIIITL